LFKNGPFSPSKKSVLLIVLLLSIAITFETFQQIYYIKRFQLLQDIRFFEVLKNQFYRWVIWMLLGGLLLPIANKNSSQVFQKFTDYKDYVFSIIGLVILNIFIISIIQLLINGDSLTLSSFWNEYFSFFLYQKAPIYTLGYSAIAIILHLYYTNKSLLIQILELGNLKETNKRLYSELSKTKDDSTKILTVKIGNKRKVITVASIQWIEADDYCVRIHTEQSMPLTMRSSLKGLESKLGHPFLRVHRKALVNTTYIEEIESGASSRLLLKNGHYIPVSQKKLKTVHEFLNSETSRL